MLLIFSFNFFHHYYMYTHRYIYVPKYNLFSSQIITCIYSYLLFLNTVSLCFPFITWLAGTNRRSNQQVTMLVGTHR